MNKILYLYWGSVVLHSILQQHSLNTLLDVCQVPSTGSNPPKLTHHLLQRDAFKHKETKWESLLLHNDKLCMTGLFQSLHIFTNFKNFFKNLFYLSFTNSMLVCIKIPYCACKLF